ncbi:hypothetical protein BH09PAT3_BH09PAT3_0910 [soil metagenome]
MNHTDPKSELTIIGRAERILFVDSCPERVPAKIDTGADLSSVWATDIVEQDDRLSFKLFGPQNICFTGETLTVPKGEYRLTRVANSFGAKEFRYVVKLLVEVQGRTFNASFTLADRSKKIYPVLLGRKLLNKKFLVDVSSGEPLLDEERKKRVKMLLELQQRED